MRLQCLFRKFMFINPVFSREHANTPTLHSPLQGVTPYQSPHHQQSPAPAQGWRTSAVTQNLLDRTPQRAPQQLLLHPGPVTQQVQDLWAQHTPNPSSPTAPQHTQHGSAGLWAVQPPPPNPAIFHPSIYLSLFIAPASPNTIYIQWMKTDTHGKGCLLWQKL